MAVPVVAVVNQKGGVGKTAVALGLAAVASVRGDRACVIDLDPQANATAGLGVESEDVPLTVNDVLAVRRRGGLADVLVASTWDGVDLAPGTLDLGNRELDGSHDMPFRLREGLDGMDLTPYKLVLLDCPPSVGRLMLAALVAASHVLIITDASADGLRGIGNVQQTIDVVRAHMNPGLRVAAVLVNKRERMGEQDAREAELREAFGDLVLQTVLPKRADAQTAHGAATPITRWKGEGARTLSILLSDVYDELLERTRATTGSAT